MPFPAIGLDVSNSQFEQPQGTTPDCRNVRTFDAEAEMARGGQRAGLVKDFTRGEADFCQAMNAFAVVIGDDDTEACT